MIQPATLDFLSSLQENNHRDWFDENRKHYKTAKENVEAVVNELISGIAGFDDKLQSLEAKQSMFRIFRDVRFSKNKAPYKTNMGAWMASGGRKSPFAGYYLHVEPGDKSFVAGGSYMPQGPILKSIREAIDYDAQSLRDVLALPAFSKVFPQLEGDKLKTAPKGYPKDHADIDLLRHKSLVVSTKITDKQLLAPGFIAQAVKYYELIAPLNVYLNRAITEAV